MQSSLVVRPLPFLPSCVRPSLLRVGDSPPALPCRCCCPTRVARRPSTARGKPPPRLAASCTVASFQTGLIPPGCGHGENMVSMPACLSNMRHKVAAVGGVAPHPPQLPSATLASGKLSHIG
ncbi:uncharacterized protein BO95DRAFT_512195 [Aspergillus brunneoviolaceus CBS 621.78]|uniref:Uncharacterized protein n=1 Tax=Aspergillus brunneoviolaceus CBS 621.78 TaxID=1450534 RepID=A0ACD1GHB2_9EURO|nr:hypothetical protein BO95DRAFT_512195 [Aspergillus brunneoviolaceus CBS 621.78]RAH48719.1 hypothetical protein BO95DRAFT_512195 [Aspergillus brunneoviolaceus CBS 621.78]